MLLRFDAGHASTGESSWLGTEGNCLAGVSLLCPKPGAFVRFHPAFGQGTNEEARSRLMEVLHGGSAWV
jgi:hypothetical protein